MKGIHGLAGADSEIIEKQVGFAGRLPTLSGLKILDPLAQHDCFARELRDELGIASAILSQHVTVMKAAGTILVRREGERLLFSLAMPEVNKARRLIRDILRVQVSEQS